jgi:hypothetical protein
MADEPVQPPRTRAVTTGIAGIAAVLGLAGGQGLILVGGGEPPFDAPAAAVQRFFECRNTDLSGRAQPPLRPLKRQSPFKTEHGDGLATRHGTSPWLKDLLDERAEK